MLAVLRWSCAVSLAVPFVTASLRVEARTAEPTAPVAPTEPTAAVEEPEPVSTAEPGSTTDSIHDAMVKAFADHFQQGRLQYNRGSYALAAAEFEQAFAAIPAEAALQNVVLSHERAGDHVAAAIAARRYLELPACDGSGVDVALCATHRTKLEESLERLLARVAELRLEVAQGVELREIRINGRLTAFEDFPVLVAAGRVDIELLGQRASQRRQRVIEVRPGEAQTVVVDGFEASPRTPDERGPTGGSAPTGGGKWLRPAFWAGVGTTSASLVALATLGGLAIQADREFERQQAAFNANRPEFDPDAEPIDEYPRDAERRFLTMRRAANVMIGVSAGLATLTLIVGVVALTRPRNVGTTRATTRIRWQFDGAGLTVRY